MTDQNEPAPVIDLTSPPSPEREVVRLETSSPFEQLSEKERARLIVRVLCELVAYDSDEVGESLSA